MTGQAGAGPWTGCRLRGPRHPSGVPWLPRRPARHRCISRMRDTPAAAAGGPECPGSVTSCAFPRPPRSCPSRWPWPARRSAPTTTPREGRPSPPMRTLRLPPPPALCTPCRSTPTARQQLQRLRGGHAGSADCEMVDVRGTGGASASASRPWEWSSMCRSSPARLGAYQISRHTRQVIRSLLWLEQPFKSLYACSGPGRTQREVPAVDELSGWLVMLGRRRSAVIDGGAIWTSRRAAGQSLTTRRAPAEQCLAEALALAIDAGRLSDTARTCTIGDPHHACRHDTPVATQASACRLWGSMNAPQCATRIRCDDQQRTVAAAHLAQFKGSYVSWYQASCCRPTDHECGHICASAGRRIDRHGSSHTAALRLLPQTHTSGSSAAGKICLCGDHLLPSLGGVRSLTRAGQHRQSFVGRQQITCNARFERMRRLNSDVYDISRSVIDGRGTTRGPKRLKSLLRTQELATTAQSTVHAIKTTTTAFLEDAVP